jgi:hypothetical protein
MIASVELSMENKRNPVAIQTPERGPISFKSLKWESRGRKGFEYQTTVLYAHISYDRIDDFINGQTMEDGSTVVWKKGDTILGAKIKKGSSRFIYSTCLLRMCFWTTSL